MGRGYITELAVHINGKGWIFKINSMGQLFIF